MGKLIIKIAQYLFAAFIGFSVFAVFANIMVATEGFPEFESEELFLTFRDHLLRGAIWAWLAGTLSGLFFFWIESKSKYLFLSFPVLFPLVFCLYYTMIH